MNTVDQQLLHLMENYGGPCLPDGVTSTVAGDLNRTGVVYMGGGLVPLVGVLPGPGRESPGVSISTNPNRSTPSVPSAAYHRSVLLDGGSHAAVSLSLDSFTPNHAYTAGAPSPSHYAPTLNTAAPPPSTPSQQQLFLVHTSADHFQRQQPPNCTLLQFFNAIQPPSQTNWQPVTQANGFNPLHNPQQLQQQPCQVPANTAFEPPLLVRQQQPFQIPQLQPLSQIQPPQPQPQQVFSLHYNVGMSPEQVGISTAPSFPMVTDNRLPFPNNLGGSGKLEVHVPPEMPKGAAALGSLSETSLPEAEAARRFTDSGKPLGVRGFLGPKSVGAREVPGAPVIPTLPPLALPMPEWGTLPSIIVGE